MALRAPKPKGDFLNIMCRSGLIPAICVDVHDEGEHEEEWQGITKLKPKVSLHFLVAETIPAVWTNPNTKETINVQEEKPNIVGLQFGPGRWFTFTMDERGSLRQFLSAWRGRDMTDSEAWDFDIETVIGVPAYLNIVHKQTQDGTKWYSRIHSALPLPKEIQAPTVPADYKRRVDRVADEDGGNGQPKAVAPANENGYGPNHDYSNEPLPSEDVVDDLPF